MKDFAFKVNLVALVRARAERCRMPFRKGASIERERFARCDTSINS
jgi:hypothetical protein